MPSSESTTIDARPIIERNDANAWTRASAHRDEIYEAFMRACAQESVEGLLLKSPPAVYPPWIKFEAWVPRAGRTTTERIGAVATIGAKPFHRQPLEIQIAYTRHGRSRTFLVREPLTGPKVHALVRYLLERGPKPYRTPWWWRRRNKVIELRRDHAATLTNWSLTLGVLLLAVGGAGPMSGMTADSGFAGQAGLVLVIAGMIAKWRLRRRHVCVQTDGKPADEPRVLLRVDSWQTVLFGLGADRELVRKRFLDAFDTPPSPHFRSHVEQVWHWGLDGKVEREQIVLRLGRAIAFCQIYEYGSDLYVGWDGHLNTGQWVERTITRGVDRRSGLPVAVAAVEPGTQPPTEYDLMDLNCLMEWTHAQFVRLVKQRLAERNIDQEIDFKIVRGERQKLTGSGEGGQAGTRQRERTLIPRIVRKQ